MNTPGAAAFARPWASRPSTNLRRNGSMKWPWRWQRGSIPQTTIQKTTMKKTTKSFLSKRGLGFPALGSDVASTLIRIAWRQSPNVNAKREWRQDLNLPSLYAAKDIADDQINGPRSNDCLNYRDRISRDREALATHEKQLDANRCDELF